jgi:hypothetical protein
MALQTSAGNDGALELVVVEIGGGCNADVRRYLAAADVGAAVSRSRSPVAGRDAARLLADAAHRPYRWTGRFRQTRSSWTAGRRAVRHLPDVVVVDTVVEGAHTRGPAAAAAVEVTTGRTAAAAAVGRSTPAGGTAGVAAAAAADIPGSHAAGDGDHAAAVAAVGGWCCSGMERRSHQRHLHHSAAVAAAGRTAQDLMTVALMVLSTDSVVLLVLDGET